MLYNIKDINTNQIDFPFFIFNPTVLEKNISVFQKNFAGKIIYAVKSNPNKYILEKIYNSGIKSFDVASIMEVKKLRNYLIRQKFFMNPVKSYQSIQESYYNYGVKSFSLDSHYELEKIIKATNYASDLNMYLRLAITNKFSIVGLSKKFGARRNQAISLLKNMKDFLRKLESHFILGPNVLIQMHTKLG